MYLYDTLNSRLPLVFHIIAQPVLQREGGSGEFFRLVRLTLGQMCWFPPPQSAISHTAWCMKGMEAGPDG